jgi:hypothetical protein
VSGKRCRGIKPEETDVDEDEDEAEEEEEEVDEAEDELDEADEEEAGFCEGFVVVAEAEAELEAEEEAVLVEVVVGLEDEAEAAVDELGAVDIAFQLILDQSNNFLSNIKCSRFIMGGNRGITQRG